MPPMLHQLTHPSLLNWGESINEYVLTERQCRFILKWILLSDSTVRVYLCTGHAIRISGIPRHALGHLLAILNPCIS